MFDSHVQFRITNQDYLIYMIINAGQIFPFSNVHYSSVRLPETSHKYLSVASFISYHNSKYCLFYATSLNSSGPTDFWHENTDDDFERNFINEYVQILKIFD